MITIVLVCSVGCGLGIIGLIASWKVSAPSINVTKSPKRPITPQQLRLGLLAVMAGLIAAASTGWPVAFVIGTVAVYGLPKLIGQTSGSVSVGKIEAIATWTEMLQGTLAASAGLGQAITTTAPLAPQVIRPATMTLAGRINSGLDPRKALLSFGEEINDPCADRVICALLLATTSRAQRLGELLSALADSTRSEVALRLRIETSRASIRSGVRTVVVFSVVFAIALVIFAHAYLAPYGSGQGQVVLALVGALYITGLTLMVVLSRPPAPVRLLGRNVEMQ